VVTDQLLKNLKAWLRKELNHTKKLYFIAGLLVTIGTCGLIAQPTGANASDLKLNNVNQGAFSDRPIQVAGIFDFLFTEPDLEERIIKFKERKAYYLEKLERIRAEVLKEGGEQFYDDLFAVMDRDEEEARSLLETGSDPEYVKNCIKSVDYQREEITLDKYKEKLFFYEFDPTDYLYKQKGEYLTVSSTDDAQGQIQCEPTIGLRIGIIDPSKKKKDKLYSIPIPKMDEDTGMIKVATRWCFNIPFVEDYPENKLVFNNAMEYLYKFFDGDVERQELEAATDEIINIGKKDISILLTAQSDWKKKGLTKDEKNQLWVKHDLMSRYESPMLEKEFGGKKYIFRYDSYMGDLYIEFPLK